MNKKGKQTRAGMLISKYLREISEEQTELVKNEDGEDKMASKAEKMARVIWKYALGFEEESTTVVNGKLEKTKETKKPSLAYINLIINRLEGKSEADRGETGRNLTDKVSEQAVNRINKFSEEKT